MSSDRKPKPGKGPEGEAFAAAALMDDPRFAEVARAIGADPEFATAVKKLDVGRLSKGFNTFDENIPEYNDYHRMERRLWSAKVGRGAVRKDLEDSLKRKVPRGRKAYQNAFGGIEECLATLEDSGLAPVLDRHLPAAMELLGDPHHPLRELLDSHMTEIGCSASMLAEGHQMMGAARYNVVDVVGKGSFSGLRGALREAVEAEVEIMNETEAEGLEYLRGRCGPPAWAVVAAKVLAYFGISVSAWWIVAAVVVVTALLITLCATRLLPASILEYCKYLSIKLKFTF
jgi:hypothetical protein